MLKINTENGICKLEIKGTVSEIGADTMAVITKIYESIQEDNAEEAKSFKEWIINNIDIAFLNPDERIKTILSRVFDRLNDLL